MNQFVPYLYSLLTSIALVLEWEDLKQTCGLSASARSWSILVQTRGAPGVTVEDEVVVIFLCQQIWKIESLPNNFYGSKI